MPTAYAYRRVSTVDQATTGFSLPAQKDAAKAYYMALKTATDKYPDLEWGGFFKDAGKSAWKYTFSEREEGGRLCSLLKKGDHIIFCRLDRAFRNIKDYVCQMEEWKNQGVIVHFVDQWINMDTANGRLLGNVLSAVAQWESDVKSERCKEVALRRKKEKRPMNRNVPAGMTVVGKGKHRRFAYDPRQRPILRLIRNYRSKGMSYKKISDAIELVLAKREKRKPIPSMHFKLKREWSADRIKFAYKQIDKILPDARPSERARILSNLLKEDE